MNSLIKLQRRRLGCANRAGEPTPEPSTSYYTDTSGPRPNLRTFDYCWVLLYLLAFAKTDWLHGIGRFASAVEHLGIAGLTWFRASPRYPG